MTDGQVQVWRDGREQWEDPPKSLADEDLAQIKRKARAEALRDAADGLGSVGVIDAAGLRRLAEFAMEDGPEPRQPLELLDPVLERFTDVVLRNRDEDLWDLWRAVLGVRYPNSAPVG